MDWGTIELQVIRLASDLQADDARIVFVVGALLIAVAIVVHLLTLHRGGKQSDDSGSHPSVNPNEPSSQTEAPPLSRKRRPAEYGPLKLGVEPQKLFVQVNEKTRPNRTDRGNIGEMVVAVLLGMEGWLQIPTQYSGNKGIDGLFIRPTSREWTIERMLNGKSTSIEVLLTETKTDNSPLKKEKKQGSSEWFTKRLKIREETEWDEHWIAVLPGIDATFREVSRLVAQAIEDQRPCLTTQLWRVYLDSGEVWVSELDPEAQQMVERFHSNQMPLIQAVTLSLAHKDMRSSDEEDDDEDAGGEEHVEGGESGSSDAADAARHDDVGARVAA
jgi:hypothetical protein